MTVGEMIQILETKDLNKEVQILGSDNGRIYNQYGHIISANPCEGIREFDDCVALLRTIG